MNETLKVLDKAPALDIPDQDGKTVSLNEYAQRWLVVYFYPKDNTPGCSLEGQAFSGLVEDFDRAATSIIGISSDSQASHCRFIEKKALRVRLLSDTDHRVQEAWGVRRTKKNFGVEYIGTVRSTFLIDPQGTIRQIWDKVKVSGHADEVLQAVQAAQAEG
jgi:peroxiredoxin Q/BCP